MLLVFAAFGDRHKSQKLRPALLGAISWDRTKSVVATTPENVSMAEAAKNWLWMPPGFFFLKDFPCRTSNSAVPKAEFLLFVTLDYFLQFMFSWNDLRAKCRRSTTHLKESVG